MGTVSEALDAISASEQVRQDATSHLPADSHVEDVTVEAGGVTFTHRQSASVCRTYEVSSDGVRYREGCVSEATSDVLSTNLGTSVDGEQSSQIATLMTRYDVGTVAEMTRRLLKLAIVRVI